MVGVNPLYVGFFFAACFAFWAMYGLACFAGKLKDRRVIKRRHKQLMREIDHHHNLVAINPVWQNQIREYIRTKKG